MNGTVPVTLVTHLARTDRHARAWRILMMTLAFALLVGCPDESADRSYAGSARHTYQLGAEAFEDGDYLEAIKHFNFVRNKYAYSKYSALADVGVADCYFEQGKYVEAIEAFRTFTQNRPTHRKVPYAMWRVGVSHFEQIPSDFFLLPPVHEKDQGSTRDALAAMKRYLIRFPDDEHAGDAQSKVEACRVLLAEHELYVARFYVMQDRPVSARGRLEVFLRDFQDVEARWRSGAALLVQVYIDLGLRTEALATAETLAKRFPAEPETEDVRDLISAEL